MNPSKTNELLETLIGACARQFGFNPRRVRAGMRYVGKEGHGKDIVHVFRDAGSHSQIVLKENFADLRETHGDKPHWAEAEQAYYQSTDAEIDAEVAAKQAELDFTRACPLYQDHREELLSHYNDWPGYKAGGPAPGEAARALVGAMAEARDPRLAAFAERMHSNDLGHLAHLLLAPCHLEVEACREHGKPG